MKFKLDENLPRSSVNIIESYGHDVHTVNFENLIGATDKKVLRQSKKEKRILITCDNDFLNSLRFPLNSFYGIIYLQILNKNRNKINEAIITVFNEIPVQEFVGRRIEFVESFIHDEFLVIYHEY